MTEPRLYSQMLNEIFEDYSGRNQDLLSKIPEYFSLLQRIYTNSDIGWQAKFKINCALSYFAVPEDIIPDNIEETGYLDDLYICAYVIREIIEDYPNQITMDILERKDELDEVINRIREAIGNKCDAVLEFVGLYKFRDMCKDAQLLCDSIDINTKIERLEMSIFDLMGLLRSVFIVYNSKPKNHKLSGLKELFEKEEWEEVIKILEEVKMHEAKFDNSHEKKIEDIRREVLLEIDEDILND